MSTDSIEEMEKSGSEGDLVILPDEPPTQIELPPRSIITRPGIGSTGRPISLLSNHFKVSLKNPEQIFCLYNVSISYEDKTLVKSKGIARKVIDKVYQTYSSELSTKKFAYDGDKILYTLGPLPCKDFIFTVEIEDTIAKSDSLTQNGSSIEAVKRSKCSLQLKTFTVEISYASEIPLKSVPLAIQGVKTESEPETETETSQDVLKVLDIVLRQQAINRNCLVVRQSFFQDDSRNTLKIGGGVTGLQGFYSSFCPTHAGLSLNMDVSTTTIVTPGPVIDFLLATQNVTEHRQIDWAKAKTMLKNLHIKTSHTNMTCKIYGLSEKPCSQLMFTMKVKDNNGKEIEGEVKEISVLNYFTTHRKIKLAYSTYMPCLNVGKSNPNYLPIELCSIVPLQRYTKALSGIQKTSLIEKSRQKPQDKIRVISEALTKYGENEDPILEDCGIIIEKKLSQLQGRVLEAPKLKLGKSVDFIPENGRWNYYNKQVHTPIRIDNWALVNFSTKYDASYISRELIRCGMKKGIDIERPYRLFEEDPLYKEAGPIERVEKMFERIMSKFQERPQFLLCVLRERKTSDLYGPWKKICLSDFGIVTQCISPVKITDQYLSNVLLKINSKLGGINSLLAIESSSLMSKVKEIPTMILGMDISHGRSDFPSIVSVVGSQSWPLISRYRAAVRSQSSKVKMIESLYKPLPNGEDDGIMRELLLDFYESSKGRKPAQIIVFRDGVSDRQFSNVLDNEVNQMIKAYQHFGEVDLPKFTVIVAQKNHHTRLFQDGASENVPPGTVVDTKVVHPRNYDFYMCAQSGMIGTSKPAHYHVLLDEIGFSPDELQNLIHSLSYVGQRSTSAISIVAPVYYAHLAAKQMRQFVDLEEMSETKSVTSEGSVINVPELPRLDNLVAGSMFFC